MQISKTEERWTNKASDVVIRSERRKGAVQGYIAWHFWGGRPTQHMDFRHRREAKNWTMLVLECPDFAEANNND